MSLPTATARRFERKKGIGLAIKALTGLLQADPGSPARLVVAGGYDVRLAENREHLEVCLCVWGGGGSALRL